MIYLFGLFLACFLFLLILLKRGKKYADYVLLAWIGWLAIHLLLFYVHYSGIAFEHPQLLGILLPIPILHGVFLYFYTIALIKEHPIPLKTILLHLIPFVILILVALPFYRLSGEEKLEVFRNQGRGYEWYSIIQMSFFLIAGFTYSILVILEIRKTRQKLLNNFSNLDKKMLRWLEYLAIGLALIWSVSAFFSDQVIFTGVVLFVLFIGFFGINQYPVFYSTSVPDVKAETTVNEKPPEEFSPDPEEKYLKSGLSEEEASNVMMQLESVMKTHRPFADADLTLNDLAEIIKVSPNHLSQVINTISGKTFYHFINTYRIQEFLKLSTLPENKKYTFLGLASECGFSSKTTFNKYFKLQTGMTPSEYFEATRV